MVNKNNKVVCGAHGVASYFVDINKKYTTLQVPIVGSIPTRSTTYTETTFRGGLSFYPQRSPRSAWILAWQDLQRAIKLSLA